MNFFGSVYSAAMVTLAVVDSRGVDVGQPYVARLQYTKTGLSYSCVLPNARPSVRDESLRVLLRALFKTPRVTD